MAAPKHRLAMSRRRVAIKSISLPARTPASTVRSGDLRSAGLKARGWCRDDLGDTEEPLQIRGGLAAAAHSSRPPIAVPPRGRRVLATGRPSYGRGATSRTVTDLRLIRMSAQLALLPSFASRKSPSPPEAGSASTVTR